MSKQQASSNADGDARAWLRGGARRGGALTSSTDPKCAKPYSTNAAAITLVISRQITTGWRSTLSTASSAFAPTPPLPTRRLWCFVYGRGTVIVPWKVEMMFCALTPFRTARRRNGRYETHVHTRVSSPMTK